MTDNRFDQLFGLVSKCVNGIQRLEEGQAKFEKDVAEIKQDLAVVKQEVQVNNRALKDLAGESLRAKARIEILEDSAH